MGISGGDEGGTRQHQLTVAQGAKEGKAERYCWSEEKAPESWDIDAKGNSVWGEPIWWTLWPIQAEPDPTVERGMILLYF